MTKDEFDENSSYIKLNYIFGAGAAFSIASILFIALIEVVSTVFVLFRDNFILKLILLHKEYNTTLESELLVVNLLDIGILVLVTITAVSFYPIILNTANKPLAIVTVVQPMLGIVMFLITQEVGRSATFTTSLTISIMLLWLDRSNNTAKLGILSSLLLLIPDISFMFAYSEILAVVMSAGYLLFVPWWFLVSWTLFKRVNVVI